MQKRVKVTLTGYYDVDMDKAEEYYGTTDPDEMLKIDTDNFMKYPSEISDYFDSSPTVELTWEG